MTTTRPPICFIDTETDGLHHGRQTWEVAIIRRDYDVDQTDEDGPRLVSWTETRMHAFVALTSMRTSDPFALNKGGFWDRHPAARELAGKPPIPGPGLDSVRVVAPAIHRLTFGAHIVGVNPTFDVENFAALLRAEGLTPQWDYHLEDLVAETAGYLRAVLATNDRLPVDHRILPEDASAYTAAVALPWRSDELAAAVGVVPAAEEDRHTAMGDAEWAMRWHDSLAALRTSEAGR